MRCTITKFSDHTLIRNPEGPVLGMAKLHIKESDGLAFKDLSGEKFEPAADDMTSYTDTCGNRYGFGFGLSYGG